MLQLTEARVYRFNCDSTHNSPLAEVISSNEDSEELPVILYINLTSLEHKWDEQLQNRL